MEDLFSQLELERRPVPKSKEQFAINIPQGQTQQSVELKVEIKDLTDRKLFNRKEFNAKRQAQEVTTFAKPFIKESESTEEPPIDPFEPRITPGNTEPSINTSTKTKRKKPPPLGPLKIEGDIPESSAPAVSAPPADIIVKGKIDKRLVLKPGVKSILSKGTITSKPQFQEIQIKRKTKAPDFETIPVTESTKLLSARI